MSVMVAALRSLRLGSRSRPELLFVGLGAFLVVAWALAVGQGAVAISPGQAAAILAAQVGVELPWTFDEAQRAVLLSIRLPRSILAVLVGAALAVGGGALQGLFRNPLADPALIGVSTGAALAAALAIVGGSAMVAVLPAALLPYLLPVAAFAGGLASTLTVYAIASRGGRTEVATMLLGGVAINAITAAGIGFLIFASSDQQLRDLNFWMLGSLGGMTWDGILPALPLIVLPTLALPFLARHLNALLLGETEALHLGFDVEWTKRLTVVLVALAVGASVALTGVIGFVGLVVPHLIRLVAGPDHRVLLPASMLLGAAFLLVADLGARTLAVPAELPIGIVMSCVGGPFFLWLLLRRRDLGLW